MSKPSRQSRPPRATHDFQERKRVVELYQSGLGSKRIAQEMGLDDSMVRMWLRKYRAHGLESLQPYWREGREVHCLRLSRREENERSFQPAFVAFSTTLEPVASITRRYGLDYQNFKYHVERYHPELVESRRQLKEGNTTIYRFSTTVSNDFTKEKVQSAGDL